ncbi:hypothetical protein [Sediminibacterium sp.]|uniref:hypothetical protein n=1 Tax=Sediminibacterium sp. TaxID=1917865 RepID=UPI002732CE94|nr:hypothetical protein [Sediminibacterium sp.]MDP3568925.1 hypothetical protein [Sediminibacterium sp.]
MADGNVLGRSIGVRERPASDAEQRSADRAGDQNRIRAALADSGANRELGRQPRPRDTREQQSPCSNVDVQNVPELCGAPADKPADEQKSEELRVGRANDRGCG